MYIQGWWVRAKWHKKIILLLLLCLSSIQQHFWHQPSRLYTQKCWNDQKKFYISLCLYTARKRLWLCALLLRLIKIKTFILVWYLRLGERETTREELGGWNEFLFYVFSSLAAAAFFLVFILCTKIYTERRSWGDYTTTTTTHSLSLSLTHIIYSTQDFWAASTAVFWVGFWECSYSLGDMVCSVHV